MASDGWITGAKSLRNSVLQVYPHQKMTEKLYYKDAYQQEFQATLLAKTTFEDKIAVELDQSCFYPSSGGQPHDLGWLDGLAVVDVVAKKERLLHLLKEEGPEIGASVVGKIDWKRRFDHMQQHTGQHILSQAFLLLLKTETESFHLGAEVSTIDLSRQELTPQEIYSVEDLANQMVFEDRPVRIHFIDSEKQHQLPIRKRSNFQGRLRIVEVADFDWSPCGGTHCRRSGEVGIIKVRRWERVKKQARVEFYCGGRALHDYRWKNRAIYRLSRLHSRADREVVAAAEEQMEREQSLRKSLSDMQSAWLAAEVNRLTRSSQKRKGIGVICEMLGEGSQREARELARKLIEDSQDRLVLLGVKGNRPALIFARSENLRYDMREWIQEAAPFIKGRGGGNPQLAQAGGTKEEGLNQALERTLELL